MNATTYAAAAFAAVALSSSAMASLDGTALNLSVTHDGAFSALSAVNNVNYTYGSPSVVNVPNWGMLTVTSPGVAPGFDHALMLDFTAFSYPALTGMFSSVGTAKLENLAEAADVSSVQVLVNGSNIGFNALAATGGFRVSWVADNALAGNPQTPHVVVAWNSIPAPGALALFGLAGMARSRRRRG